LAHILILKLRFIFSTSSR